MRIILAQERVRILALGVSEEVVRRNIYCLRQETLNQLKD